ncbi:hypothetical protein Dcae01_02540 [Deinococcus caeni]|uniref:Uncharacterized protein n=1 Tax=Deinococcus caeni TaxID=569127 RepID=A0ABP9UE37_9DEIO
MRLVEQERNAPPDVEPAGALTFRIAGETNASPYDTAAFADALRELLGTAPMPPALDAAEVRHV